jgi:hypothetical protein
MYKPKTLHPGGYSNPGFSVLEADAMTTMPRRLGCISLNGLLRKFKFHRRK